MTDDVPLDQLERLLAAAQERQQTALAALRGKHQGGEWETYRAAHDELLVLERRVAAAKGEPHAIPLEFPLRWDIGAPLPHLIRNDNQTFLTFLLDDTNPN